MTISNERRFGPRNAVALPFAIWVMLLMISPRLAFAQSSDTPPSTKMQPVTDVLHDVKIVDPYRWLEDQKSPETRAWITAQNNHTDKVLGAFPGRDWIEKRAAELLKVDSIGMPSVRENRYFFSKRLANEDLPKIYLRIGIEGKDEVLLDPATFSEDGSKTLSLQDISPDGKLLIYAIRTGGEDEVALRLFDVDTRKDLQEFPRARYFGVSLTPDARKMYYTLHDEEGSRVYEWEVGTEPATARKIFGDGYESGVIISPGLSLDGQYLIIHVFYGSAAPKSDIYFQDLKAGTPIQPLVNDIEARFGGAAVDNRLFVQTNWNAPNNRLLLVDLTKPGRDNWQEIVPESRAVIDDFSLAGEKLYVNFLDDVKTRVSLYEPDGTHVRDIQFPTLGTVSSIRGEWDQPDVFYAFSSFHIPATLFRERVATGEQSIWARSEIPVESDRFTAQQVWFTSKDGTRVPMFLVHKKGLVLDGNNPTLLYGYGGFNVSLTPQYSSKAILWIEQGGVYAVANLRGGGEFGEEWHRAGMLDRKQNVFDDFYAAADWLIEHGYTQSSRLAIAGGSNGGLLVGTALTQRPELFRAVVCSYPLLDMIRYHQFLVARFWIPEYGSSDDPDQFRVLHAYSPYHHVKPGVKYPATLFITGDADTRVDPLHARKMAALLQTAATKDRPVLLRYDTKLGHTGARPVKGVIEDLAAELSFLFEELGVTVMAEKAERGAKSESDKLHAILDADWEWSLREFPTFASYLGDTRYNDRWNDVSLAAHERRHAYRQETLRKIDAINLAALSEADRLNLTLFRKQLVTDIEGERFLWYLVPLTARDGIQDESSLADIITFQEVKDYEDWITRLETFPVYSGQTMELMREGIRTKTLLPKIVMKRVPSQLKRQIVEDPTQSLFYKPLLSFPEEIPQTERDRLAKQAAAAIQTKVVPAYREFLKFFKDEYLPACFDEVGASQIPHGHEFYAYRARVYTTTKLTPREIHEIGLSEVKRIRKEMDEVIRQTKFDGTFQEFLEFLRTDPQFYFTDPNDLLAAYQSLCKRIDPQLTKLFKRLPRIPYGVEPIPAHMAPDTTTAYYRPPSADGSRAGTYFVNLYKPEVRPKYEFEALSLHEAVPGHHLQIALAAELDNLPPFRRYGELTAYVEGWALYAESLGNDLGLYRDPYSRFGQLTYEMWRAVRLVVDTGMHDMGWTRQQGIDFFKANTAKTEHDIVNEIDRYIAWPGQALAYKIGELKIRELRTRAEKTLGDRFDLREFHDVVLRNGAVPLDVLEDLVDKWIAETSKK